MSGTRSLNILGWILVTVLVAGIGSGLALLFGTPPAQQAHTSTQERHTPTASRLKPTASAPDKGTAPQPTRTPSAVSRHPIVTEHVDQSATPSESSAFMAAEHQSTASAPTTIDDSEIAAFERWLDDLEAGRVTTRSSNPATASSNNPRARQDRTAANQRDTIDAAVESSRERIRGRVLSNHGNLIANARITALPRREDVTTVKQVFSGANGEFILEGLSAGNWYLSASTEDGLRSPGKLFRSGERNAVLEITAPLALSIRGVLSGHQGEAVSGATIAVEGSDASTTSDSQGQFTLEADIDTRHGVLLQVDADGYEHATHHITRFDRNQSIEIDIQLQPSGQQWVSGIVLAQDGTPIHKAYVELQTTRERFRKGTHTDQSGAFQIEGVPDTPTGRLRVEAGNAYLPWQQNQVELDSYAMLSITLQSAEQSALETLIVDSNGESMPGMSFLAYSSVPDARTVNFTSDRDGTLHMTPLRPGGLRLQSMIRSPRIDITGIELGQGTERLPALQMDIGSNVVRGRVLWQDQSPIADAQLTMEHVVSDGSIQIRSQRTTASAPDGSFEFSGLGTGQRTLHVSLDGVGERELVVDPMRADTETLVLF